MTRKQIFLPAVMEACSALMSTTFGDSRYPTRTKVVIVSPRKVFPTDACPKLACISTAVPLLVIKAVFGKSVHTSLKWVPSGLSKGIRSWIKRRLRL